MEIKNKCGKTDFIIFKNGKRKEKVPDLFMGNTEIIQKDSVKYLRQTLDNKMTYNVHVANVKKKANIMIGILSNLIGRRSCLSIHNILILYTATARPEISYASTIWSSTSETNINKLQCVQNKCLRMIGKAGPRARNSDLHKKYKIKTIKELIYNEAENFYTNYIAIPELDELREEFIIYREERLMPFKLKHKMPYQILLQ